MKMLRTPFYLPQPVSRRGGALAIRLERWLSEREAKRPEAFLARSADVQDLERRQAHLERFGLPDPI